MLPTRHLGRTGLLVTPIGLGLAAIGRPGYINVGREADLGHERSIETLRARAHSLLDAARDLGVRYVDAARSYGLAEEFLGSWLRSRAIDPGSISVGSKWGYTYTADWVVGAEVNEVKDHTLPTLQRQVAESRALLAPWLGLYQIHSATIESGVLRDAAVLGALARLKGDGLAIGMSVSGPRQADTVRLALEARVDGQMVFDAVQATWNVLEPSVGSALAEAHAAGLGIIVKEALANGRLAGPWPGAGAAVQADIGAAIDAGVGGVRTSADAGPGPGAGPGPERGTPRPLPSGDALAIAAALAQPWAGVVLSGAVTADQLRSNLGALDIELPAGTLEAFEPLAIEPGTYWAERSALPWT
jgi:aryl-alcohol dehydrogenase-like predicted oxidoreductase